MKAFTLWVASLMLLLGTSLPGYSTTGGDCGCKDSENALTNGGFENGLNGWTKWGNAEFLTVKDYKVCGTYSARIKGKGALYQDKQIAPGTKVDISAYGGTHDLGFDHFFIVEFYNGNTQLSQGRVQKKMDNNVDNNNGRLKQFTFSATAPSNATKVRFIIYNEGNYFKADVVCISLTPPKPADCGCTDAENFVKNGSFEDETNHWQKTGDAKFYTSTQFAMCGGKNGMIEGRGSIFQEVNLTPGSVVRLSAYAGTHNTGDTHEFRLIFFNSSGGEVGRKTVDMNHHISGNTLAKFSFDATAPAGSVKVRVQAYSGAGFFKLDGVCVDVDLKPVAECCTDQDNKLKNGSFESGSDNWTIASKTNFEINTGYVVCGAKNGVINGAGEIYQDVDIAGGSTVTVKAYGGAHNTQNISHAFKLVFYNGSNRLDEGRAETDMDHLVSSGPLKQFTVTGTAPANATKVRFIIYSGGDFFKVDAACMSVTPPPVTNCSACTDAETVAKNPSFESGTEHWQKTPSGTNFSVVDKPFACGSKVGMIDGNGIVYQEIMLAPGSVVNASIWGGVSDAEKSHKFYVVFYNGSTMLDGAHRREVEVDKNAAGGLQQYSFSTTAPSNADRVMIAAFSGGGKFYFDALCVSVTPPTQCENCNGNKIVNGGFENGTDSWATEGNVTASPDAKNCENNGMKIDGAGRFSQDIQFQSNWGSNWSLAFWAAKRQSGTQTVQIFFYDESGKELETKSLEITKVYSAPPVGFTKYTMVGAVPETTTDIKIVVTSSGDVLSVDQTCLTFSGPSLPVTLSSFNVTKEGTTASLRWSTSEETNSDHFDIQHSVDGKNWGTLKSIQAQGESKGEVNYSYTHTKPSTSNFYRLKMVDFDGTFAYSRIRNLEFNGGEQLSIYPNPTADRIKLSSNQQVENVKIYSQSGKLVLNAKPDASNEVDLSKMAEGIYFVKINDSTAIRKIVVVR